MYSIICIGRVAVRSYVPSVEVRSRLSGLCALAAGAPTNAARDLAFLPAHLLYRAIHKCILSSLLPFCLSSWVARRLRSSRRLPSARQRMHRGLLFVLLSPSPPRSRLFFFPSTFSASPSSSRSPRRVLSSSFSLPPPVHPFSVPSLLTVSLRRVLKSVVKPGYETGQSAEPRNYTRVYVCFCLHAWTCVRAFLVHDATDAPRDIRLCWRGRERTLVRADARTCSRHGPEK